MSTPATLLFLHGLSGKKSPPNDEWQTTLDTTLRSIGYPGLDSVTVIAPKYPHSLAPHPHDESYELPDVTIPNLRGAEAAQHRREVSIRTSRLEHLLAISQHKGHGLLAAPAALPLPDWAPSLLNVVTTYLEKESQTRARVLRRVLDHDDFPTTGRLVIVGHSMGSVIAVDLLRHLPPEVTVAGLITIGSPLAHARFHMAPDRLTLKSPPANVPSWVNLWGDKDPVTFSSGVSRGFPWVLDQKLQLLGHSAKTYFTDETVARAVGHSLFGSLNKSLVVANSLPAVAMNPDHARILLASRYGELVHSEMTQRGDRRTRFAAALAVTQHELALALEAQRSATRAPFPEAVQNFVDSVLTRSEDDTRFAQHTVPQHLEPPEATELVVALAMDNPVAPFDIEIERAEQREALKRLTAAMGSESSLGERVFNAVEFARKEVSPKRSRLKWGVVGLGSLAIVAGTGGLALAAAPGLAGAAAITSALAAFGPGGMIGGLVTAGALTSAGAGSVVGALAREGSTRAVEEAVVFHLALLHICRAEQVPLLSQSRDFIDALGQEVAVELRRHLEISDADSAILRGLRSKLVAAEAARAKILEWDEENPLQISFTEVTTGA